MAYTTKIGLGNFRVFKEMQNIDLENITVFTGTNNSGKSSVIKALYLLTENSKNNNITKLDFNLGEEIHKLGEFKNILPAMKKLTENIKPDFGILATLGNHDSYRMVEYFEDLGIRMLINETVEIEKDGQKIIVTGTDDTYYFYTDEAAYSLENDLKGFKIALSHTSELHDIASANGYSLYLCGHTHGGQICLPGGIPVIAHQKDGKQFVKGEWHVNGMTGYTSSGVGVSGVSLRYNCPAEIVLITLNKKK